MKLLVIDFEATCYKNAPIQNQEIIEFPTVLIDAHTLEVEDHFHRFVKPIMNPKLSDFCTQLTGITQEQVDGAQPFEAVLQEHTSWLASKGLFDHPNLFAVVTFGDWDFMCMFPKQCDLSGFPVPHHFRRWINLKTLACAFTGFPKKATCHDLVTNYFDLEWQGATHSGLDDSKNVAALLQHLLREGMPLYETSMLTYSGRRKWTHIENAWVFKEEA